ncbi:MAG: hypothetical protein ACKVQB_01245 [Bacteroidia bacterium]
MFKSLCGFVGLSRKIFNVLTIFLSFWVINSSSAFAQQDSFSKRFESRELGLMLQVYPAGVIPTLNYELISEKKLSYIFRVGGNFANRKNFSTYNNYEKGKGFGVSLGCRKYFSLKKGNLMAGVNTDVWNMWIDWENDIGNPNQSEGKSYTLVVQPWLEVGYSLKIGPSPFKLVISTGFGREINVITKGRDVGQGWMNSGVLYLQYIL